MSKIFLSHATEEHDLVVHLANYLEKNDLEAWYAPRNIMGGIDYDREIIAAIKDCRAFVLILSHNSDASEDVKTEVYHAVKFKKVVICLDVDDVEPENLSYLLGMRHRLNWLERRDETLDKLVHDIRMIPDPSSRKITKPTVEVKPSVETKPIIEAKQTVEVKPPIETKPTVKPGPTAETKPIIEPTPTIKPRPAIEAKPKTENKALIKESASDPATESWIKENRIKGIILLAVIAAIVGVLAFNYIITVIHEKETARIFRLAREGTPEEIREAAKAGTNFSITSEYYDLRHGIVTTLYVAVIFNTPEAVKAIIETGVDINAVGCLNSGSTALRQASSLGKYDTVKVLIDAGADVNIQIKEGTSLGSITALMIAAAENQTEIVKFLLKHGADKSIRDRWGSTAYDYAVEVASRREDFDSSILTLLQ